MISLYDQANLFLYNAKIGDHYLSGGEKVSINKRTGKRIYLSNGVIIHIKKTDKGIIYLDSKSIIRNNKPYPLVNQILRDIEGYLVYNIHNKSIIPFVV